MDLAPIKRRDCGGDKKEKIPLVHHILTDEELGLTKAMKLMNLNRAIKLLTDIHSQHMVERQINALHRIAKRYKHGYLMRDLVQVFKILNICADRMLENELFIEPLCALLYNCRLPFLKEKMSDEITYQQIVVESLSQLGYLMRVPNPMVRTVLTDVLSTIYSNPSPSKTLEETQGLRGASREYNRRMIECSDLPETLVKSLSLLTNNLPLRVKVLKLIKLLSNSPANCSQMLLSEAAFRICRDMIRIEHQNPESDLLLFESVEILWNMLENGGKMTAHQLANVDCVTAIKKKFRELMTSSCSNYQRQLRNDLLVITTLIARHPDNHIVETGFARDLILFATFTEVKSHNPLVKNLRLTQCHEDFELKKLLINMLCVLSKDLSVPQLYTDGKVILSLFHFVKANSNDKDNIANKWTPAQFEELQLHAMSTLTILVTLLVDEYMACQGNIRLLLLLEWCVSKDDVYSGDGNSFHGKGSRGGKRGQLRYCLRLLRAAVFTGHPMLLQDLCDQGVLSQILQILHKFPVDKTDAIDIEIKCDLLHILSALCENDIHRKELLGAHGVEVLINFLKEYMKKQATLGHHRVLLATVDSINCCVVGCFTTEDIFLENEGIFLLLDLLEIAPRSLYNLTLTCLLELTENHKTIAHLHTWRGNDGKVTCGHLMASLWREEEQLLGVERGVSGTVTDIRNPLAGYLQRKEVTIAQPSTSPSSAIVDVSENLRSKIYSVFTRLGFSDLPGLTTEDYVTLAIIEKYLDLKAGEVWKEVAMEIELEKVKPVSTDEEALATIERATLERSRGVAILQRELLEAERQQNITDEKDVYLELKSINRQFENEKARWTDHVHRTSNYRHLCAIKRHQLRSIESSRTKPHQHHFNRKQVMTSTSTEFHDTMIKKLQTTTFQGRHVTIETAKPQAVLSREMELV